MGIYEVFVESATARQLQHVGSVQAPTARLAIQAAREIYFRRDACLRLGVVPREAVAWSTAPEDLLTARNVARSYRTPAFFGKRRRRERLGRDLPPPLVDISAESTGSGVASQDEAR